LIEEIYRRESRRVLATLIRLLGDFDLAEEALQDAFAEAVAKWPETGVPANPRSWLISTGRFKAIDQVRRRAKFDASLEAISLQLGGSGGQPPHGEAEWQSTAIDDEHVEDDQLRLIFTCCHPALPQEAQVALTLREVCGLTTEEIARAFFTGAPTVAQRIVRAKGKIRDAGIPYQVPTRADLPERLESVLQVVYLVFNEGYLASSGDSLTRLDLSAEAIRLGRLIMDLLPEPEVLGLLALMLLHESRRAARTSIEGEPILMEDQDRAKWNRAMIDEGISLIERSLSSGQYGRYSLQAAISAVHAGAASAAETDWREIVGLYDALVLIDSSPIVQLNRAAAVAMRDGPEVGIALIDEILARGELAEYQFAHSARGELCRRAGRLPEARASFARALELAKLEPERRFLTRRIEALA
jgi:RNA polymerase sigma-70 factor (ECF subfamily)